MTDAFAGRISTLKTILESYRESMLQDLRALVEIESPSDNPTGINQISSRLSGALAPLGFEIHPIAHAGYGDHLLAECKVPQKPGVLFCGHMDTVFPSGTGWGFSTQGMRAYGPGVSDMKAGLIGLVYAFRLLHETGGLPVSARVFFNSEEEIGSPTSIPLLPELSRGMDYACVLEPSEPDGSIITRRKGIGKFTLTVKGRAAHAGQQPELGINANRELAFLVLAADALADPSQGTTINAGRMEGGSVPYIISDWARALIDVRVWSKIEQSRIKQEMKRLADTHHVPGTQIEVTGGFHRPPMLPIPGTEKLTKALEQAARACGQEIHFCGGGAASDGNNLAALGLPTIDGLGPAGGRAHSRDEYLELSSFFDRTLLLAAFLLEMGSTT